MHPNRLVEEAIIAGRIEELEGYEVIRREVRYDERCRIDLLLHQGGRPDCFVEVKNVHLKRIAGAEFPDAVTVRGAKHLGALARQVAQARGRSCSMWCRGPIAPTFASPPTSTRSMPRASRAALDGGVEALCYACEVSLEDVRLAAPLPISAVIGFRPDDV